MYSCFKINEPKQAIEKRSEYKENRRQEAGVRNREAENLGQDIFK
jgi:hypothetical protein